VYLDSLGSATAKVMLFITVGAQFYCGMSSITSASRMMYAFSRDGATPGHALWRRLNAQRVPVYSVWAIAVLAFLCAFPAYFSKDIGVGAGYVAYAAVTSIATIGLYIAYALPIYLRLRAGDAWVPGEWNLGRWYKPIGWIAVVWVAFIGAVHPPARAVRDARQRLVHVAVLQLRADRRRRSARALRRLVARVGEALVPRSDRAGDRGGAGPARGAVRGRRHAAARGLGECGRGAGRAGSPPGFDDVPLQHRSVCVARDERHGPAEAAS